jgi:phosphoribosylanthranilate isomerase
MTKIKICGITNIEDALICIREGADALGFIFTKKSSRFINEKEAKKIISHLDPFTARVGVFLDEEKEKVFAIATELALDVLQFHGQETPAYCHSFMPRFKVIKTIFPENRPFAAARARFNVDAFLFDVAPQDKAQGVASLDKETLKEIDALSKAGARVIISGGLTAKNISRFKKLRPYAFDVASGLEKFVGKKDESLVRAFIQKVKAEGDR